MQINISQGKKLPGSQALARTTFVEQIFEKASSTSSKAKLYPQQKSQ
jgi:hypothetical protein